MTHRVSIVLLAVLVTFGALLLLRTVLPGFGGPTPSSLPTMSEVAEGDAEEDAGSEAPAEQELPEGFVPVAFLSDVPVQAFDAAAAVLEEGRDYHAIVETTVGTMQFDLYEARTPVTVNNFVFLALHRYFEDVAFHRVIDGFVAQGGDPTGTGTGGPGYQFADEIDPELVHDRAGLLSMANVGPDTNGSQFFITMAATGWLDGAHAVFGEVVDGLEVLDALARVDPQTPQVIARFSDPVQVLVDQGVVEAAGFDGTVEAWLETQLGSIPDGSEAFRVAGRRGVLGTSGGSAALGLFHEPDRMLRVTIVTRTLEEDPS